MVSWFVNCMPRSLSVERGESTDVMCWLLTPLAGRVAHGLLRWYAQHRLSAAVPVFHNYVNVANAAVEQL